MGMKACCPGVGYNRLRELLSPGATGMDSVTVFVGLDYHSQAVQVCVLDGRGHVLSNRPCPNDAAAIRARVAAFGERVFAAVEACTGAAALADELAATPGWAV